MHAAVSLSQCTMLGQLDSKCSIHPLCATGSAATACNCTAQNPNCCCHFLELPPNTIAHAADVTFGHVLSPAVCALRQPCSCCCLSLSATACCSACELLLAVLRYHKAATYAVQQHASGSAVHVLCGLLLVLHHQLATCSNRQQQHKKSNKAPKSLS
jgi:hypothetical protein